MARKKDTRKHSKPGTIKFTMNVDPELKGKAKVYAIVHGWDDLTSFIHDSLRYAMKRELMKGGV